MNKNIKQIELILIIWLLLGVTAFVKAYSKDARSVAKDQIPIKHAKEAVNHEKSQRLLEDFNKQPITPREKFVPEMLYQHSASYHKHPGGEHQPACLVLTNDRDEIHLIFDPWPTISTIEIKKGSLPPYQQIEVGYTLAKLKKIFPKGEMKRVQSELTDPVIYHVQNEKGTFHFTVEWEKTFQEQGGKWKTFDPKKIPDTAKILSIYWW